MAFLEGIAGYVERKGSKKSREKAAKNAATRRKAGKDIP